MIWVALGLLAALAGWAWWVWFTGRDYDFRVRVSAVVRELDRRSAVKRTQRGGESHE